MEREDVATSCMETTASAYETGKVHAQEGAELHGIKCMEGTTGMDERISLWMNMTMEMSMRLGFQG